jgi:hypothetical protein
MFIFVVLGTHPYTLNVIFISVNDDSVNVMVFRNASLSLSEVWLYLVHINCHPVERKWQNCRHMKELN